jgi:uncharacterized membrane protein
MNTNVRQILTSLGLLAGAVILFILFAPLFIFLVIFLMIFSFFLNRKIRRQNPDFFKKNNKRKGRVIDQEDYNHSNDSQFNQKIR